MAKSSVFINGFDYGGLLFASLLRKLNNVSEGVDFEFLFFIIIVRGLNNMTQNEFSGHSGYFIQEIARKTNYLLNASLASLGITYAQFRVLNCLWKKGVLRQKEIHEIIAVKASTLTGLVNLLAAKGLLERRVSEEDARANRICLTDRGCDLQKPVWKVIEAFELRMTEGISEAEKSSLMESLKTINSNLE